MIPDTVLYVEDDEADVFFMKRAFEILGASYCLRVVGNGRDAVAYLAGTNGFSNREENPLPSLVLLDLKLPGIQGLEVLTWIRQQPQFQSLPVVVFTSSDLESDREQARQLGISDYMVKPGDMTVIHRMVTPLLKQFLGIEAPIEPLPATTEL